ncbi:hypothetical protein ACFL6L_03050 [candidate division KSB1 bacterium]
MFLFKAVIYGVLFFFVWRILRSIFSPQQPEGHIYTESKRPMEKEKSFYIDENNIEDAQFNDLDNDKQSSE